MIDADYKSFVDKQNLKQLRKTIRRINKVKFPEQYKFVQNTITERETERKKLEELIENPLQINNHVISVNPDTIFTKENINHVLFMLKDEEDDYIIFEKSYHMFLRITGNPSKGFFAEYKNHKKEIFTSINTKLDIELITKLCYSYCNNESYWHDYCEWDTNHSTVVFIPENIKKIEKISLILGIISLVGFIVLSKYHDFDRSEYFHGVNGFDLILLPFILITLNSLEKIIIWFRTKENHLGFYEKISLYLTSFMLIIRIGVIVFGKY